MLIYRTSFFTFIILVLLAPHLAASNPGMMPVDEVPVAKQAAVQDQTDDLEKVLGRGQIVFGGQYVCPDFANIVSQQLGDVLNDRQQRKLTAFCKGDPKVPECFRSNYWPKAIRMLEDFKSSGLSQKPHFASQVIEIARKIFHRNCWYDKHMSFLLNPAVMAFSPDAKDVMNVLDLLIEQRFDSKQYKEALVKSRRERTVRPSKEKYERHKIPSASLAWVNQSGVLALCHNNRDLRQLLGILGKEYNMPLWDPVSTLKKNPRYLYWHGSKFTTNETDNILGWLQHAGVISVCQNLEQLQQIFDLFSACSEYIRTQLFQVTEKSGILRNVPNPRALLDFLQYMTSRAASKENRLALAAMRHLGAVSQVTPLEEFIQIFERLASYAPEVELRDREGRNERHLEALKKSGALKLCQSAQQLSQLLNAVAKDTVINLLRGKLWGQRFISFDHLMDVVGKLNDSPSLREKVEKFLDAYPGAYYKWNNLDNELRAQFTSMIYGLRALDRDLAKDILYLGALMLSDEKETCPHRAYGRTCREEGCKMPMLIRALLESTLNYSDVRYPEVVDMVLDWTPEPSSLGGESYDFSFHLADRRAMGLNQPDVYKGLVYQGRSLLGLSADQRRFFLSLPFKAFGLSGCCYYETIWFPIKGPAIASMIIFALSMPQDLLEKTIRWIRKAGLNNLPLVYDRLDADEEEKLKRIKKIFCRSSYEREATWKEIEHSIQILVFPDSVMPCPRK